jgi:hypothetical protein
VRLIHQREHHSLENWILVEERHQEVHLHKEQQLEEPVQAVLVKYLHRVEVVVQRSEWQDMIPPSGYHNLKEKHWRTQKNICSYVKRFGKKNISQMKILN